MRTSHRWGAFAFGLQPLVFLAALCLLSLIAFTGEPRQVSADPGTPNIDTTVEAVQTFYRNGNGVPHTDALGNLRTSYDSALSFFPNGLYFLTPCTVSQDISWGALSGQAPDGWDGGYHLTVNLGSQLDLADPSRIVSDQVVSSTAVTVDLLPAATSLYYSVRLEGTDEVTSEGTFTSADCPDPALAAPVATAQDAGFNFAITRTAVDTLALADQAAGSGFKLVPSLSEAGGLFETLKNDPVAYGWYLADEPLLWSRLNGEDPAVAYNNLSLVCYSLCPQTSQVFFLTESSVSLYDPFWPQFIELGDAGVHYNYPKTSPGPLWSLWSVANSLRHQASILKGLKPSWLVVESFGAETGMAWEFLTPQEMRATVYTAVIHGATGIIHFAWDSYVMRGVGLMGIGPSPPSAPSGDRAADSVALWDALASPEDGVNHELEALTPIILSRTSWEPYRVFVDQQPISRAPIRTMLKEYDGSYYLLAVNIDNAPINARFLFTPSFERVEALFEDSPTFQSGRSSLVDNFEPFGVHVYKLQFLCPDVNGDGAISIFDLRDIVIKLWGSGKDGKYEYRFDVNSDGAINILDLQMTWYAKGHLCTRPIPP